MYSSEYLLQVCPCAKHRTHWLHLRKLLYKLKLTEVK